MEKRLYLSCAPWRKRLAFALLLITAPLLSACTDEGEEPAPGHREEPAADKGKTVNGHEFVDLALPSGLLWATCNIGADSPEKTGDYYAWGETAAKLYYSWDTYAWAEKVGKEDGYDCKDGTCRFYKFTRYNGTDGKTALETGDDAATANWGAEARTPTQADFAELQTHCQLSSATRNGVRGTEVKGRNGKTIFIPATGSRDGWSLLPDSETGWYWTSDRHPSDLFSAYTLRFNGDGLSPTPGKRFTGYPVRAVSEGK